MNGEVFALWSPLSTSLAFVDASGIAWIEEHQGQSIMFDVNGLKGPNKYGRDRFAIQPIVHNGDIDTPGIPDKLQVLHDYVNIDAAGCPSGGCYYKTWLIE